MRGEQEGQSNRFRFSISIGYPIPNLAVIIQIKDKVKESFLEYDYYQKIKIIKNELMPDLFCSYQLVYVADEKNI